MSESTVIYTRQSFDRHADNLAVDRQLKACRKLVKERGWTVAAEYVDNDTSATTGVQRPGFEAVLKARPARVVVWHIDRLLRVTRDLERVIELGTNVHAVKAGHLDLSNPAGRAVARTVTAWSTYETEQKAERQRAANDQRAESGLPYRCQRAFGYEPDGITVRESEAAELRAAAEGVIRGRSLNGLATDLNNRGILTAPGNRWNQTTLKGALLSPRNHGERRHRGEVVGKAAWPAIFDPDTGAAVRAILTDPTRSQAGPPRRYLLSGVMQCGKCGEPVVGAFVKTKGETYRCPTLHLSRQSPPVDEYVTEVVAARLSLPDAVELFAGKGSADLARSLNDERALIRARLDGLAEAFAAGDIDRQQLNAGTRRQRARLEEIDRDLAATVAEPDLADVVGAVDVLDAIEAKPLEVRRKIIDRVCRVTLLPVGSGRRNVRASDSVRVEPRAD